MDMLQEIMGTSLDKQTLRDNIQILEDSCKAGIKDKTLVPVITKLSEYFSDGCYGRQIFIPKGTCLVGEIHKTEWIIVVSRGKIQIATDTGIQIIDATKEPVTFISEAGAKRAGFALEDTWWTGFRATPLTTEEDIRKEHLVDSYNDLEINQCG
jgi:hypothetical protein